LFSPLYGGEKEQRLWLWDEAGGSLIHSFHCQLFLHVRKKKTKKKFPNMKNKTKTS
jgi:hypothetical protein